MALFLPFELALALWLFTAAATVDLPFCCLPDSVWGDTSLCLWMSPRGLMGSEGSKVLMVAWSSQRA